VSPFFIDSVGRLTGSQGGQDAQKAPGTCRDIEPAHSCQHLDVLAIKAKDRQRCKTAISRLWDGFFVLFLLSQVTDFRYFYKSIPSSVQ
jgi:hypothetical protein